MTIHIIVVAYALADDLVTLYESCAGKDVRWHLFLHSAFPPVVAACEKLARDPRVQLVRIGFNRGLARSWNDGLLAARLARADASLIANDDASAGKGDLYRLVQAAAQHPDAFMVSGMGYDVRAGATGDQRFALAVINPVALDRLGCFDENFYPVYFEDLDWYRRAELAGLSRLCIDGTAIVHAGSKTLHTATDMEAHHQRFRANRAYYVRKWGGPPGAETFTRPFDQPQFDTHIAPLWRSQPYPGFNRPREEKHA